MQSFCKGIYFHDSVTTSFLTNILTYSNRRYRLHLTGFFGDLGESLATRPFTWVLISFFLCFAACSGFSKFFSENRQEKLWSPQDTDAVLDGQKFSSHYDNPFWVEYVVIEPGTDAGTNMLTKENLVNLMALHDDVEALTSEFEEGTVDTLNSLCYLMPIDGHPCFISSILSLWEYNMTTLLSDADVQETIGDYDLDKLDLMLGGLDSSVAGAYTAEAAKITYFLENRQVEVKGKMEDLHAQAWEKEFLDLMMECDETKHKCFRMAGRSFGDEFGGAIKGDVVFMNVSFLIIILYLSINLGSCCGGVKSRITLSMVSCLAIGLAIGASMGLSSWCGQPYTNLHSVLPFVMLGLGVDDSFVIMNAFVQTNLDDDIKVRMRQAMSHAGVSITVTSMTDFVAFGISTTTSLPALSSFCFYASTGILFLFIFQCTLFGAGVVYDARRQKEGRRDFLDCCSCCLGRKPAPLTAEDNKQGTVSKFMKESFGPFVTNKTVRPVLLLINLGLLVFGCWGASQMEVKSNQKSFIPDGSYILDTFDINEKYFSGDGTKVSIVTENFNYFSKQASLKDVSTRLEGKAHLQDTKGPNFESWFDEYSGFLAANCYGGCVGVQLDANGLSTDEAEFYSNLQLWLSGAGGRFSDSIVFEEGSTTNIMTTKMGAVFDGRINNIAAQEVEAMQQIREEIATWDFPAYAYTYQFTTWETYVIIEHEMVVNVALCMVAVFIITLILIAHPVTATLVLISVAVAIAEILGAMHVAGLFIDNVSVIYLTLAVGLAVDYSAHIGHCFMLKGGDNRTERVIEALTDIGSPVLNGAISTFLAVVVLSVSKSYVFRAMFIQFFLTVIFGVLNGLTLLPVLLCYVGPPAYVGAHVSGGTTTDIEFAAVSNKPDYDAAPGGAIVAKGEPVNI